MPEDKVHWTLTLIEKLQKNGIGDLQKFNVIRSYLERDGKLTDTDREYLKEKFRELERLEKSGDTSKITTEPEEGDSVEKLKDEVKYLTEKLGKIEQSVDKNPKNKKTILMLAILSGFIGLPGLAHLYIGKTATGIWLMIASIIGGALLLTIPSVMHRMSLMEIEGLFRFEMIIVGGWFAVYFWQIYDAYTYQNKSKLRRTIHIVGLTFSIIAGLAGIVYLVGYVSQEVT